MKVLWILILSLFTNAFIPCFSQVISLKKIDSSERFPITPYTALFRTTQPITIDSVVKSPDSFKRAENKPVLVYNYDPYDYWFRFIVQNNDATSRPIMLLMAPVGIFEAKLYQKVSGQWREVAHTGLKYKFRDRSYQFAHHVFPFSLPANKIDTLYLGIDATNAYKSFGFALMPPKTLKIFENKIYFIFGIIEGLLILFFVLNVSLFFALKEKIHLWYSLYIFLLFLIVLKNDHLDQQFLGLDSERAFRLTPYLTIGAFAIGVLMHVVQTLFRNLITSNKFLYRISYVLKVNVLLSSGVHYFIFGIASNYKLHSFVFNWAKVSTLLGIIIIMVICLYCFRKGNKSALFIFVGTSVFLIGSVQRLFFPSTLSFLFPPTTFHIGIIVETLVISLGLIYRYWNEKEIHRLREQQIQTQTMHDISEEIHDNVGQILALAKLNLSSIGFGNEKTSDKISDTKKLINKAISELRDLSRTLKNEEAAETSIAKQIKAEILNLEKIGFIKTQFSVTGYEEPLENKKRFILIRLVREVLQNVIKHSKASLLEVSLIFEQNQLQLTIYDNGVGFNVAETSTNSNGLKNICKRCVLLNASCDIQSREGEGTKIILHMPGNTRLEKAGL